MARLKAALAVAVALVAAAPAMAHQGNPNFLSEVESAPRGVDVEVLNRDDALLLRAERGTEVVVEGYDGEPYARIDGDGEVSVNTDSPAYYLNDDRFGDVPVPDDADGKGAPRWKRLDGSGRFEWHDHRMHWMSKGRPPQVSDPDVRTKVFDWSVPTSRGPIEGTLFWTPEAKASTTVIVIASAVVLVLCAGALVIRRHRDRTEREPEAW